MQRIFAVFSANANRRSLHLRERKKLHACNKSIVIKLLHVQKSFSMHVSSSSGEIAQQIANQPGELRESVVDLLNMRKGGEKSHRTAQKMLWRQPVTTLSPESEVQAHSRRVSGDYRQQTAARETETWAVNAYVNIWFQETTTDGDFTSLSSNRQP